MLGGLSGYRVAVKSRTASEHGSLPRRTVIGTRTDYGFRVGKHATQRSGIKSDPNREDDPEYIVNLVGRVVKVSLETVKIVKSLPEEYSTSGEPEA